MQKRPEPSSTKIPSWQVKGVTFETREAVKTAARKSGMTMGEWVNETLHSAAVTAISGQSNLPAYRIEDQLAAITAQLDELRRPFWRRILGTTRR
jgi:localization factor PodJL